MSFYQDKLVFVTGGSTGIGCAIAKALAKEGSHICIFARTPSKLETARKEIQQGCADPQLQKIQAYTVDMSAHHEVQATFENAIHKNGIPDILINCVGIAQPDYFENITFDIFDKTIKTNLYATWNSVYSMVPHMKKKKGGHIVNTSSIAGFLGVFGYTDYCMTKFGIIGFSDALRQEMAQYDIHVSVLCPPDTDTPGFEAENKNKPEETKAIGGKATLLKPEEVAAVVLQGIRKKKELIIPGAEGKLTLFLKRFFPFILDGVMAGSIRKVQQAKNK